MSRAPLLYASIAAALLSPRLARADGPADEDRAFVEVTTAKPAYFVGERMGVRLRVGYDSEWFLKNAVPLFARAMDVPIHVEAPWLRALPAGAVLPPARVVPPGDRPRSSLAVNDDAIDGLRAGDVQREGRTYAVIEIERAYLPERAGELHFAAPTLRFAYATRFEGNLVSDRIAVDRHDVKREGVGLAIQVLPLPAEGRPPEFEGAVGRFRVEAAADRTTVEAGGIVTLTLRIEGEGNLDTLDAPRLDRLAGFHAYGAIDDRSFGRRTIRYEIAPLDATVKEVPPIPFAYFDPGPPAAYHVVRTPAIPLDVKPRPGAPPAPPAARSPAAGDGAPGRPWVLASGAALLILIGLGLLRRMRRSARREGAVDAHTARIVAATAAIRSRAGVPGHDAAAAFAEYLAAHLGCEGSAVVSPDLSSRLEAAGIAPDLASRAAATLESLVAARYGGSAGGAAAGDSVGSLLDALESAWGAATPRGSDPPTSIPQRSFPPR